MTTPTQPPAAPQPQQNAYAPAPQQQAVVNPKDAQLAKYRQLTIVLAIVSGILLITTLIFGGIVVSSAVAKAQQSHNGLAQAYAACKDKEEDVLTLADGNKTLSIDASKYSDLSAYTCVAKSLSIPESIESKVGSTTGLSGTQNDEWDSYKVTWSYNGNTGFNMVIEEK